MPEISLILQAMRLLSTKMVFLYLTVLFVCALHKEANAEALALQGFLDTRDKPTEVSLRVSVFEHPFGGAAIDRFYFPVVPVHSGKFLIILDIPIPPADGKPLYLSFYVKRANEGDNAWEQLEPRQPVFFVGRRQLVVLQTGNHAFFGGMRNVALIY